MSEFGFQSFPSFETMKYINQTEETTLMTDSWKSHQKHDRGLQLIFDYMERDYKVPMQDDDYIYVSQLAQAKGIVMGIEAHRRAKPYNMGTLYWQLNDCWPAISWSSMDYFGNWKALQYRAKEAFENLLLSTTFKNNKVSIYIINDNFEIYSDDLIIELIDFKGNVLWSDKKLISIEKDSSKKVYELDLKNKNIDTKKTYLRVKFYSDLKISFLEKPKNLLLENSKIITSLNKLEEGFLLTLESKTLQKDVFLYTSKEGHFNRNFFDLEPNEVDTIFFKTNANSLDDLQIKTLNSINDAIIPKKTGI
jgi:beta-mannosidase